MISEMCWTSDSQQCLGSGGGWGGGSHSHLGLPNAKTTGTRLIDVLIKIMFSVLNVLVTIVMS